jgi:16S rRNA G966 N2-methylase RsmD
MVMKGTSISEEVKQKIRETKKQKMLSKYKWEIIESYLDTEIDIGSRNRNKKFITLREFKKLILEGNNLVTIKKLGISKHLLQFYSNFSQGKIILTKDKFIEEYESGLSLDEIAIKYKFARDDLTYLRQLYGQKSKGAKFIERKKTEVPLTQRQKEILYGSMMGDAKKMSSSSVAFNHGPGQKGYLLWKYNEFKNVASERSLKGTSYIDKRSEDEACRWTFYTYANTDVEKCVSEFYNGTKEISLNILEKLTPLSIAIWYQDDGTTDFNHRSIVSKNYNIKPVFAFCTESFSRESCENIKKWFNDKYDINVSLKERILSDKIGYRIKVDIDSVDKFVELIKPHILPMFSYKINYDVYKDKRESKEIQVINGEVLECPLGADFSSLNTIKQEEHIDGLIDFYQSKGIERLIDRPHKWENHMSRVININPENLIRESYISFSNLGNRFLMSHFPNFWSAKAKGGQSPKEVFNNKEYLGDIIRQIIIQGYFPSQEKILKALQRYRGNKKVSGFMPCVAKSIYHKYCNDGDRVLDFCAGYGGRLFGSMSCDKVKSYTGIEVNFDTYLGLQNLHNTLRLHGEIKKEVTILNQDSILGMQQFRDNVFDFCFTSPPYFNAELYEDESGQSFNKYPKYGQWFEEYLIGAVREAMRVSKRVAINMDNTGGYMIADDLEKWMTSKSIPYIIDKIRLPNFGAEFKYSYIFVI